MRSTRPISSALLQVSTHQQQHQFWIRASTNHIKLYLPSSPRSFSSNPFTPNQSITAHRTLPYPSSVIYSIISDVGSYSHFLPYCHASTVTQLSNPAPDGKRYPSEAKLSISFFASGSISEHFTSRVYCVPERIVEAISGRSAETSLSEHEIAHHGPRPEISRDASRQENGVMTHLRTRWTLRPYHYKPPPAVGGALPKQQQQQQSKAGKTEEEIERMRNSESNEVAETNLAQTSGLNARERTEVSLVVEFAFSNPLYAALSSAAAPKVAEKMIEAFEERVKAVVEGPANAKRLK